MLSAESLIRLFCISAGTAIPHSSSTLNPFGNGNRSGIPCFTGTLFHLLLKKGLFDNAEIIFLARLRLSGFSSRIAQ